MREFGKSARFLRLAAKSLLRGRVATCKTWSAFFSILQLSFGGVGLKKRFPFLFLHFPICRAPLTCRGYNCGAGLRLARTSRAARDLNIVKEEKLFLE